MIDCGVEGESVGERQTVERTLPGGTYVKVVSDRVFEHTCSVLRRDRNCESEWRRGRRGRRECLKTPLASTVVAVVVEWQCHVLRCCLCWCWCYYC